MSDIERDLEELGRRVWPDPEPVRRCVVFDNTAHRRGRGPRFSRPLGAFLGIATAIVLIGGASAAGVVALQHHAADARRPGGIGRNDASAGVASGANGAQSGRTGTSTGSRPTASAGVSAAPQLSSSPRPIVQSPAGGALTITASSRGTYEVELGTTITVDLTGGPLNSPWSMPSSTPAQIVRLERGLRSAAGGVIATFVAAGIGEASIHAARSPRCPPLCGPPSYLWQVEIVVVA
jgi:hypothetical protein